MSMFLRFEGRGLVDDYDEGALLAEVSPHYANNSRIPNCIFFCQHHSRI
jgi:hypothetical protein